MPRCARNDQRDFGKTLRPEVAHHSQAILSTSELVTIGVLQALKNVSQRAFYRWFKDKYGHPFPKTPHRTRLNRRLRAQQDWTGCFPAQATALGVTDGYGMEWFRGPLGLHPWPRSTS